MSIKTSIKIINGNEYLYLSDSIYIAPGFSKLKNKSLGRADYLTEIPQEEIFRFDEQLKKEEKIERSKFWINKVKNKSYKNYVQVEKIEDLRTDLYKTKNDIGTIADKLMETAFIVDFIYNSNRIEGSKLPRESVEKMIQQKSSRKNSNNEVINTVKAINYINNSFKWNRNEIKKLHTILMSHEPTKIGYRNGPVIVGNSKTADWEQIQQLLVGLLKWYKETRQSDYYPPELAFEFYYRFERIHPFFDGNGRIGRLLMNKILKEHRYHPIIVWNSSDGSHMNAFIKYMDSGQGTKYHKFMGRQLVKTYKIYLKKVKDAINLDKLTEEFLKPSL